MKKVLWLLCILSCFYIAAKSQNKSGYSWIFGSGGIYAQFNGDTSKPITNELYPSFTLPQGPYYFDGGSSCICDSNTGRILFACNGGVVYDSLGFKIDNGDSLIPDKIYHHNAYPDLNETQATMVLPKGNLGEYYIFTTTITDSLYNYLDTSNAQIWHYNLLQYHILDMNANGGMGKVISKNIPLLEHEIINRVGMMACRHANGKDWWIIKNGGFDSSIFYKILVTSDTVMVKDTQTFSTAFGIWDMKGQSCFSRDGKRYAYAMGKANKLFLADFDRCNGEFRNQKVINIPIDSTLDPFDASLQRLDSLVRGVCFSSNDSFIYVTRAYNIYQYELHNTDSVTAWYHVQYGPDTVLPYFGLYGHMMRGIDDRIYIGYTQGGSFFRGLGVINKPNSKGANCEFNGGQLKYSQSIYSMTAPANMPDFTLGADSSGCWPLSNEQLIVNNEQWALYPNPVNAILYIKNAKGKKKKLYNTYGQLLISTTKEEIDISGLAKGLYFLSCEQQTQKVLVE